MSGMALTVGATPVKSVYVGSTPVKAVYVGSTLVWQAVKEVVQITLGTGSQARDQFRAALTDRGLNYASVTEVPFEIELVGTGSMSGMFEDCSALKSVPDMDTSQVTDMSSMFYYCRSLTSVPDMDTSQVTDMSNMFRSCSSLTSVPDMDTSSVTNMGYMFYYCRSLTDGNVRLIGRRTNVNTTDMITGSGLTREPFYDDPTIETVQITLGTGYEARDQFRAALSTRGLHYNTVTEIPFDIELVGTGSTVAMFNNCWSLTHVPEMDTSSVTTMAYMFSYCSSLVSVPDMDTAQVTDASYMFYSCQSLTDGNVRLIGRHPSVTTSNMIASSGLTREPFHTTDGGTAEVHEVSLTDVRGSGTLHPLLTVTVPAGETWSVRIQGTITKAPGNYTLYPHFRIGPTDSETYGQGAAVDFSGTVTAANSTIGLVSKSYVGISFTGTVTIEK